MFSKTRVTENVPHCVITMVTGHCSQLSVYPRLPSLTVGVYVYTFRGCHPLGFSIITRVLSGRIALNFDHRTFDQFDMFPKKIGTPNT